MHYIIIVLRQFTFLNHVPGSHSHSCSHSCSRFTCTHTYPTQHYKFSRPYEKSCPHTASQVTHAVPLSGCG